MTRSPEHPERNSTPEQLPESSEPELACPEETAARPHTPSAEDELGVDSGYVTFDPGALLRKPFEQTDSSPAGVKPSVEDSTSDDGQPAAEDTNTTDEAAAEASPATSINGDDGGDNPPPPPPAHAEGGDDEGARVQRIINKCKDDIRKLQERVGRPAPQEQSVSNSVLIKLIQAAENQEPEEARITADENWTRLDEPTIGEEVAANLARMGAGETEAYDHLGYKLHVEREVAVENGYDQPRLDMTVEGCAHMGVPPYRWVEKGAVNDLHAQQLLTEYYVRSKAVNSAHAEIIKDEANAHVQSVAESHDSAEALLAAAPGLLAAATGTETKDAVVEACAGAVIREPYETPTAERLFEMAASTLPDTEISLGKLKRLDEAVDSTLQAMDARRQDIARTVAPHHIDFMHQNMQKWKLGYMVRRGDSKEDIALAYQLACADPPANLRNQEEALAGQAARQFMKQGDAEGARYMLDAVTSPETQERLLRACWKQATTPEQIRQLGVPPAVENQFANTIYQDKHDRELQLTKDAGAVAADISETMSSLPQATRLDRLMLSIHSSIRHLSTLDVTRAAEVASDFVLQMHEELPEEATIKNLTPCYEALAKHGKAEDLQLARQSILLARNSRVIDKALALATLVRPGKLWWWERTP